MNQIQSDNLKGTVIVIGAPLGLGLLFVCGFLIGGVLGGGIAVLVALLILSKYFTRIWD
jgi:hypothetical protein